jgi:hypothetical protein
VSQLREQGSDCRSVRARRLAEDEARLRHVLKHGGYLRTSVGMLAFADPFDLDGGRVHAC